jgi:DNA repair exonuclease SbcCD nuclease subunit
VEAGADVRALFYADAHVGAGDRMDDQRAVLSAIAGIAVEREVDAVLFAGDATHHRSIIAEVALFQEFVGEVTRNGIPFHACAGNHDRSTMDVPSTLEVAARGFRHAHVADRPGIVGRVNGVHIAALPWCPTSAISALHPDGSHDDVVRTAEEILMDVARGLRASVEGPAVLLLHWSLSGAITPTGADVSEFREVVLPSHELADMGFDAILAGHIHSAGMVIEHRVPVLYAGSPNVCDFGEADTAHGVWIIDTDTTPVRCEFVPVSDRKFVTLGYDPQTGTIVGGNDHPQIDGAIVRVRYSTTAELERSTDHQALKDQLLALGVHRVASIQPDIVRADGLRSAITEDVSIDDAFAQWLAGQDVEVAQVERVGSVHHEIREAVR